MSLQSINPEPLGEPRGWTNGMLAPPGGGILFVAGQTARDPAGRIVEGGLVDQWEQALANVLMVVESAGGRPNDIARMTIFMTDLKEYRRQLKEIGAVWRARMGRHYPAMSVVEVSALVDEDAVIEIEATAVIP
ncbi:MAG TPA: RidA family protein [Longimicrobiales bacterium]|nr:RidA family protein [Longimicrobiales bacterium]